ncbi:Type 1 glutamine amidotransferase-like domain-containing protein [Flavobacterium taihuense]|uniref:Type 1 glutamine amidotransferase-like domain-containing protein n=1 Tax=Flavobacterium taihuense TaxID=2857508 RepID=A0ABS6XXS6_9FLAO|nr:Type 1 glutamine amidotransferase-like domain-containing protein [Flavobacterium taihuense]
METIFIDSKAKAGIAAIATKIRNAEALFISGGDQATYVSYWKDTPVEDAINYLINTKKVPVGGTSAGCAILGKFYYSAANTSITSAQALADPYDRGITIGANDFLNSPILANTITDTHYDNPDRKGRKTTFLVRMWKDLDAGLNGKGIGVYEKTAVCIDQNGIARVFAPTTASFAYFYQIESYSTPETVVSVSLSSLLLGRTYNVEIVGNCTSGASAAGVTTFTTTGGTSVSYCASKGNSSSSEWISKVVFGTIIIYPL